jgi:hypothetical protein
MEARDRNNSETRGRREVKKPKARIVSHRPRVIDHTPPSWKLPPCSAQVVTESTMSWRTRNIEQIRKAERLDRDLYQCFQTATYEINGRWYCRKHAALVALDLLAEEAP